MRNLYDRFLTPPNEYRGKPFWSWNGELNEEELIRQIHILKRMGFGGFFMHSRTGLATEYLGEEWFRLTNRCAEESSKLNMEAWLYDEDRWPSGTAGGMVTVNPEYRMHYLCMRIVPGERFRWKNDAVAAFSCSLSGLCYKDIARLEETTPPAAYVGQSVLLFTVEEMKPSSFYNGYTYVDTMNREAIDRYIALTHEKYKEHCGDKFGTAIQGIFTDEPHRGAVMAGFGCSNENRLQMTPWTKKLPEEFLQRFGYDIVSLLPELFLQPYGRKISQVKWHYMELLQELFLENYAKPIYEWCEKNNLKLTGHVLHEDSLTAQAVMQGSLMRFYEWMHVPGVDVLTEGNRNYWIVKQLTSAARQLGKEWLLSELYGCTGWQMNFQGHKEVGDWQALFGINLRCHHLSWYTMEGEAKRDFPASILHQSAWWKEYEYVESYFARLGLLLHQGEPCCDILVVNPIESLWCQIHAGWANGLSATTQEVMDIEKSYQELFHWLTGAHMDFDYGDEEMLGRLSSIEMDEHGKPVLRVGHASYHVALLGGMTTVRSTTLQLMERFHQAGGQVIFVGDAPGYVDAIISSAARKIADNCIHLPWDGGLLTAQCRQTTDYSLDFFEGAERKPVKDVFCQMRDAGRYRILATLNVNPGRAHPEVIVRIPGVWGVEEWDCRNGRRWSIPTTNAGGLIEFHADYAPSQEHIYLLVPEGATQASPLAIRQKSERLVVEGPFEYRLLEPNVCVLDIAKWKIGREDWREATEILKVDQKIRAHFGIPLRGGEMVQPWYREKVQPKSDDLGRVTLEFEFDVEVIPEGDVFLAVERPGQFHISLNDRKIANAPQDWWVDIAFQKVPIPKDSFRIGRNLLQLGVDFYPHTNLEAVYLLGDFGVRVEGHRAILISKPAKLSIGDITRQGLPFYGGAIIYQAELPSNIGADTVLELEASRFEAACMKVRGKNRDAILAFKPWRTEISSDMMVNGMLELEVVLTRRNTFGPLHQIPLRAPGYGPGNWITEGKAFSLDYGLYPAGILEPLKISRLQ
jgi:hypothetical protein